MVRLSAARVHTPRRIRQAAGARTSRPPLKTRRFSVFRRIVMSASGSPSTRTSRRACPRHRRPASISRMSAPVAVAAHRSPRAASSPLRRAARSRRSSYAPCSSMKPASEPDATLTPARRARSRRSHIASSDSSAHRFDPRGVCGIRRGRGGRRLVHEQGRHEICAALHHQLQACRRRSSERARRCRSPPRWRRAGAARRRYARRHERPARAPRRKPP